MNFRIRQFLVIASAGILLAAVACAFWVQDLKYSLPTPQPASLAAVAFGSQPELPAMPGVADGRPLFLHFFKISVWDLRAASKRIAVVKQDRKDQLGGGQVAERGMVSSLLLQSQYGNGNSATKKNCSNLENEDAVKIQESVASGSILSTSVPRFMAGYEDGSISCFDIRTFRYALNIVI